MDELKLDKKPTNPFAKGKSAYSVECLIKQEDVERFGVRQEWVGKRIRRSIYEWPEIIPSITADVIRSRLKQEEKDRVLGKEHRDWRMIAGLDEFITRNHQTAESRSRRHKKKVTPPSEIERMSQSWLCGKPISGL